MTRPVRIDDKWFDWATPTQAKYLRAVKEHKTFRAAAKALAAAGDTTHHSTIGKSIEAVRKKAALNGYAPEYDLTHPVPSTHVLKGASTLYGEDGKVKAQWVKSKLDPLKAQEAIREWVERLAESVEGKIKPIPPPAYADNDLLAVYPIGDPHFGMYAWAAETGVDFDVAVADRITRGAIDRLVGCAPAAGTALIAELGDFFHADNSSGLTPNSHNQLDTDTRWAKVMQVGTDAMEYVVRRALEKHANVIVWINPGNHDPHSAFALAMILSKAFRDEPRVTVDLTPSSYRYLRFGKVLIGSTHGDKSKMKDLAGIMAADRAEDWGQTKFRYWYCGHIHHVKAEEFHGVIVEYFRTLAGPDAWHAGKGYRAGRDMRCIVMHREFGEVERHRCDVAMLEAA